MKITYYTVASTRCMGIWRDEDIVVPSGDPTAPYIEYFNGFETREAAEAFIRSYPKIFERKHSKYVRNVKLEREVNGKFILTYEAKYGWGENCRWKETHFHLDVNEFTFSLVPGSKDVLMLDMK